MPHVQITLIEGRSEDEKRRIASGVTDVMVKEGGAKAEFVTIAFVDVPRTNFARGGTLSSDRVRTPKKD